MYILVDNANTSRGVKAVDLLTMTIVQQQW
jgi:hypothetical protein